MISASPELGSASMAEIWNHALDTGIAFVDEQHRQQHDLVVRFSKIPTSENGADEMHALLADLRALTIQHFHDEETLISEVDPSGAGEHIRCHRRFITLLDEIIEEFDRPSSLFPPMIAAMKARTLLFAWFDDHIRRHDAHLRTHLPRRTFDAQRSAH